MRFKKAFLSLSLLYTFTAGNAQDLTGSWEGVMNDNEFIQINIVEKGDSLCGYTYDYMGPESYCKAHFKATYHSGKKIWYSTETGFIEIKGNHVLMQLRFIIENKKGNLILKGTVVQLYPTPVKEGNETSIYRDEVSQNGRFYSVPVRQVNEASFFAKKVSPKPVIMTAEMNNFMRDQKPMVKTDQ